MTLRGLAVLIAVLAVPLPAAQSPAPVHGPALLSFAGFEWTVKESQGGGSIGPGPCVYGRDGAWVDGRGRLHLAVVERWGRWVCAEVVSRRTFGYGDYRFAVQETSALAPNAVMGLFLWDPTARDDSFREVDIEISRWAEGAPPSLHGGAPPAVRRLNAQFVKQPFTRPGNLDRFEIPPGRAQLSFAWRPGQLRFHASVSGKTVRRFVVTKGVFVAGASQVRMNLWMYRGAPPLDGRSQEIVVEDFGFVPLSRAR